MKPITPTRTLDGRGKTITTYVIFHAVSDLQEMEEGDILEILTDEFEPFIWDVAAWCRATGNRLLSSQATAEGHRFLIEKKGPHGRAGTLAMVLTQQGLEETLSPLGFALAAALEGTEVHLYIQGPAVRLLAKGFRPKLKGWARPFSRFAARDLTKHGHVPAQEKLAQLRELGATIYMCGPSMEHFKVHQADLVFDGLPIIEYLTFMAIMSEADIQLYV